MPARIRELFQPNRTSNFANVNKVNSFVLSTSSSSLDAASVENFSSASAQLTVLGTIYSSREPETKDFNRNLTYVAIIIKTVELS